MFEKHVSLMLYTLNLKSLPLVLGLTQGPSVFEHGTMGQGILAHAMYTLTVHDCVCLLVIALHAELARYEEVEKFRSFPQAAIEQTTKVLALFKIHTPPDVLARALQ